MQGPLARALGYTKLTVRIMCGAVHSSLGFSRNFKYPECHTTRHRDLGVCFMILLDFLIAMRGVIAGGSSSPDDGGDGPGPSKSSKPKGKGTQEVAKSTPTGKGKKKVSESTSEEEEEEDEEEDYEVDCEEDDSNSGSDSDSSD